MGFVLWVFESEEKNEKRDLIAKFWEFGNELSLRILGLAVFSVLAFKRLGFLGFK